MGELMLFREGWGHHYGAGKQLGSCDHRAEAVSFASEHDRIARD
jgi:hypothetical protein